MNISYHMQVDLLVRPLGLGIQEQKLAVTLRQTNIITINGKLTPNACCTQGAGVRVLEMVSND